MAEAFDSLTDRGLVERARGGEREAFGELYARYFPAVYDFVRRLVRDADETSDVAQETFLRAMRSLHSLKKPDRFKSWVLSIAHNQAINRLERQRREVTTGREADRDEEEAETTDPLLSQIDRDRLANPDQAADVQELANLVWEAARGLDPRQYALLDLHVRQGLESAEIAEVLGVSKGNASTMLNRMRTAVEGAIGAFLLARRGSTDCDQLRAMLEPVNIPAVSPELRRNINRHALGCEVCTNTRKRLLSPVEILGALAPIPVPLGVQEAVWGSLQGSWAGASAASPAGAGGGPPSTGVASGSTAGGFSGWSAVALATVAAGIAAVIVGVTIMATSGSDGPAAVAPPVATATPVATPSMPAEAEPDVTPTPEPTPEPTPVPTPEPTPVPTRTPPSDDEGPAIRYGDLGTNRIYDRYDRDRCRTVSTSLTATIEDPSGVDRVTVVSSFPSGVFVVSGKLTGSTEMFPVGDGDYVVKLFSPANILGPAPLELAIRAWDSLGNMSIYDDLPSVKVLDC